MSDVVDMKGDWNRRARERPEKYIAGFHDASEAEFRESGRRDVSIFFGGIEQLLSEGRDVVDIGCGIGRMDEFLAPRVRSLIGVDVSGEMVARARERLAHLPNLSFVEGDGSSLPLPDDSADLVFSHVVFQHVPRRLVPRYFAEALRVLRPGGSFVFQLPQRGARTPSDAPDRDTYTMRFWDIDDVEARLRELGFELRPRESAEVGLPGERFLSLRFHAVKSAAR
ncbi:MAG: class I SAM-dependent methyltransferase [Planctomycetes bacterium]|nr:class I SAM-dependent methyltransferase [Planctomycetota bacterium]